jgi:DNA repair exonuclease SbcCD nuclease subunit
MGKVLLWSDLHIAPHKKEWKRLENCLDVLRWVFKTALQRGIKDIVFCGDLFHDRNKIDIYVYHRTFEVLQQYLSDNRMTMYCLVGNHDMWHHEKRDITSVRPFEALPGFYFIDETCSIPIQGKVFDFLPFTHDPISMLTKLSGEQRSKRVLCGHIAVDGAQLNAMHNTRAEVEIEHDGDMVKVSVDVFKDWQRVFLGHYHGEQKLTPTIEYIGSPLQLSYGEAFQFKHIVVYDTDTDEREYIRNDFSPVHWIIPASDIEKYELKDNFVRLEVDDLAATDLMDLRNKIVKEYKVGSLEIKQAVKEVETNHVIEDAKSILYKEDEMLERYIDEAGTDGLDKAKLLEIGKLVCKPIPPEDVEATS